MKTYHTELLREESARNKIVRIFNKTSDKMSPQTLCMGDVAQKIAWIQTLLSNRIKCVKLKPTRLVPPSQS